MSKAWDCFYMDEEISGGICEAMERPGLFVKSIAWVVTFAFLWQIGLPLAEAAANGTLANPPAKVVNPYAQAPTATKPHVKTEEDEFTETITEIEKKIARITAKLDRGEDESVEEEDLKKLEGKIKKLSASLEEKFVAEEDELKAKKLPQVILDRQAAMVQAYKTELNTLLDNIRALGAAATPADKRAAAEKAKAHLESRKHHRKSDFNPNDLPSGIRDGKKTRKPIETEKGFKVSGLFEPKGVAVAALGSITLPPNAGTAPTAEDLAATTDVQITQPIRDLAASLGNDPVKIYNWVHDNIQFLPTYGSIQGSDMTLQTGKGNAFDTSSLLIALLRAAGVHARYGYGTVQIPIDKVMNWIGDVSDPAAAINLLSQGDIPVEAVASGGQIKAVKMEQVWVEAWVDYIPSRAARHREGDNWIPMDASFKQYTYTQGMDLQTAVPFDAYAFSQQLAAGAQIDPALGSVTGIDTYAMQATMDNYRVQLVDHINVTDPYATMGDALGAQTIIPSQLPHLASSLPYKIVARGGAFSSLTDNMRTEFDLTLYATMADQVSGTPSITYRSSLPNLANKRLTFTYEPATAADQAVIQNAMDSYETALPAYLIQVKPVLKVDGITVATGPSVQMGESGSMTLGFNFPFFSTSKNYPVVMGTFADISLNYVGVTKDMFLQRVAEHNLSAGADPDFTDEMFHQLGLAYWGELDGYGDLLGKMRHVPHYRFPSHGLAMSPLSVSRIFGIPKSATYLSRVLDIKENLITAIHSSNDAELRRQYALQIGLMGSYLESSVLDQMFLNNPGTSISTSEILNIANQQGNPVHRIDVSNSSVVLPNIALTADELSAIQGAISAGKVVTVPERRISHNGWSGTGYIIEDPVTGAGAYMISGGRNGGSSPAPAFGYPVGSMPATGVPPILIDMLSFSPLLLVLPIIENGMMVGIRATGELIGEEIIIVLAVLLSIAALMTKSVSISQTDSYPEDPIYLRHYTSVDSINLILKNFPPTIVLWNSNTGWHGRGVYFAPVIEEEYRGIVCYPTQQQAQSSADLYELSGVGVHPADWKKAERYIDIVVTRPSLYHIEDLPRNAVGGLEYVIKDMPVLGLVIPAPGIEYVSDCR